MVESLLPILVWVLEGLASCRAQLREREEEAEKEKEEREELLQRYQSEKTLRRESQEVRDNLWDKLKVFCEFFNHLQFIFNEFYSKKCSKKVNFGV